MQQQLILAAAKLWPNVETAEENAVSDRFNHGNSMIFNA